MARVILQHGIVLVDSITEITEMDVDAVIISGSHGGRSAAGFAAAQPALVYIFNDAGVGKDKAGIAGLDDLEAVGQAACCVAAESARIGDAHDTWANGILSASNQQAAEKGFSIGSKLQGCVARLLGD